MSEDVATQEPHEAGEQRLHTDPGSQQLGGYARAKSLRWFVWIAIPLLSFAVAYSGIKKTSRVSGLDFYHLWGIGASFKLVTEQPPNPYVTPDETSEVLNRHTDASSDMTLKETNALRRIIDPTGTPFFYSSFAFLPLDFGAGRIAFSLLQFAFFAVGALTLLRGSAVDWPWAVVITFVMVLTFKPFDVDLRVGNVNAIQLFLLAGVTSLYHRWRQFLAFQYLTIVVLVIITCWKPNVLPVTAMLGVALALQRGIRHAVAFSGVALVTAAVVIVVSAMWFGQTRIWLDWYNYLYTTDPGKISSYSILDGNIAFPTLLANVAGTPPRYWGLFSLVFLAATATLAMRIGASRSGRSLWNHIIVLSYNGWFVLAVGVCTTAAIAPLMWRHYLTWVAAAPLWIVCSRRRLDGPRVVAALALMLYWEPPGLVSLLGSQTLDVVQSATWTLTWLSLLAVMSDQ